MEPTDLPPGHRSGFVAMAGRPNVGKSTLLNAYLGQSIAAVSPKPQTTRQRQLGILTLEGAQVIFVDTPGLHTPHHTLGSRMNEAAEEALVDADLILVLFDLGEEPTDDDRRVVDALHALERPRPTLAALNKVDLVGPNELQARFNAFEALLPEAEMIPISATRGDARDVLLERVIAELPEGPRYYPAETITDAYERDIAADLIRASAMHMLRHEVPYSVAVRIDEYKERGERGAYIGATLFVERESQKGIVIGRGGTMLREIGTMARKEIEAMSGRKVYLDLRVKTLPGWRDDEEALRRMGYPSGSS
jgi:GTP-binding protein Era